MNKIEQKLLGAIQASGCHQVFAHNAFDRIAHGGLASGRHLVDSISNIRIKVHPYGCITRLTANVGIVLPDQDKRGEGKLTYKFSLATRKYKVEVKGK
jgi:hypothetical protein